jgi:hypothetical protein
MGSAHEVLHKVRAAHEAFAAVRIPVLAFLAAVFALAVHEDVVITVARARNHRTSAADARLSLVFINAHAILGFRFNFVHGYTPALKRYLLLDASPVSRYGESPD